jgi:hypothetical protein
MDMRRTMDLEALLRQANLPKYMRDTDSGRDALGRLVAAALQSAEEACEAERLDDPCSEDDAAYERAIDDCQTAIRALKPS